MILGKDYVPHIRVNLQHFAGTVKNKVDGVDPDGLKALKDDLDKDDDSDNDDEDQDDDKDTDDDEDEKEDIDEDPDKDDDDEEGDDDTDEESDDEEGDSEDQDDDEDDTGKSKKAKKGGQPNKGEGSKDKKTNAIIALKGQVKELQSTITELLKSQRERDYDSEMDKLVARFTEELIEDGMDEEKAKKRAKSMAEDKIEAKKSADRDIDIQVDRLEEKGYTDIRSKLPVLRPIVQKSGLSLEEAYRAKYGDVGAKSKKTKDEQNALLEKQQQKKTSKAAAATKAAPAKTPEKVVLSKRDERIFTEMQKKDPKLTRKAYVSLMKDFTED
jgi:hypothetical protein